MHETEQLDQLERQLAGHIKAFIEGAENPSDREARLVALNYTLILARAQEEYLRLRSVNNDDLLSFRTTASTQHERLYTGSSSSLRLAENELVQLRVAVSLEAARNATLSAALSDMQAMLNKSALPTTSQLAAASPFLPRTQLFNPQDKQWFN